MLREVGRFQHCATYSSEARQSEAPQPNKRNSHAPGEGSLLVLTVSADAFLVEMCRKMVTVAVAVMRGWLTEPQLEFLLATEELIPTVPTAPLTSLCLSNLTFRRCFPQPPAWLSPAQEEAHTVWKDALMQREVQQLDCAAFDTWLTTAVRPWAEAAAALLAATSPSAGPALDLPARLRGLPAMPSEHQACYTRVLELLREADRGGAWPETSEGRSKVIQRETLVEQGPPSPPARSPGAHIAQPPWMWEADEGVLSRSVRCRIGWGNLLATPFSRSF